MQASRLFDATNTVIFCIKASIIKQAESTQSGLQMNLSIFINTSIVVS